MPGDPFAVLPLVLADRWRVERLLGQGGMATVYLARDQKHGRNVAIKVLRPEIGAALGTDRFLREIQIAAKLNHPHILPLFDSIEVDGRLLYVMPYVAGESLRQRLDRGPMPIGEAVEIGRQVASGLDYAHREGVVHRDIKPENVLLQGDQALISDFGIARAIDAAALGGGQLTETGITLGTPPYMSPEQIAGDRVGPPSDIYSLGCVLYEMLTGKPPFEGASAREVLGRHATEPATSPRLRRAEIPRDLAAAVLVALAKDPNDRFRTGGELIDALTGAAPPRRPRGLAVKLATFTTAATIVALAAWWRTSRKASPSHAAVAVLYLENRTRDSSDQYLADGITEETIAKLGALERLSIPSRGRVRPLRGLPLTEPARLGTKLGVDYLVGGTLERGAAGIRVRMELVRAADGAQLWGGSFVLATIDPLAIEDSVARSVATEVIGRLAPAERALIEAKPTENLAAYDHYLKGNFYFSRRTSANDGWLALKEYQAALALEPRFPQALGRLGLVYGVFAYWPWVDPGVGLDTLIARGLDAANRAIALDSGGADGWLARGFLLTPAAGDPDGWRAFAASPNLGSFVPRCWSGVSHCADSAVIALARAARLAPKDAEAWYQYGRMVRGDLGDSAVRRSLDLEPDRAVSAWFLGLRALATRRTSLALTMLDSAVALGRHDRSVLGLRIEARLVSGDLAGAANDLGALRRLPDEDPIAATFSKALETALLARRGEPDRARRLADSLADERSRDRAMHPSLTLFTALALVQVGQLDRALALLARVPGGVTVAGGLPSTLWDPVRSRPEFGRIAERFSDWGVAPPPVDLRPR